MVEPEPSAAEPSVSDLLRSTPGLAGRLLTGSQLQHGAPSRDTLPLAPAWVPIVPGGGLQRGRVYACRGTGARSLALAMVARAVAGGSWLAAVDVGDLGYGAMAEAGIALERVVAVSTGGAGNVARVLGALCDGFDLIIVGSSVRDLTDTRRLVSRVQAQRSVLVIVGEHGPLVPDVVLSGEGASWAFDSHARRRTLTVRCHGRRVAGESTHRIEVPPDEVW